MLDTLLDAIQTLYYGFRHPERSGITKREETAIRARTNGAFRLVTPEQDDRLYKEYRQLCLQAGLIRPPKLILYEADRPNATCLHTGAILLSTGVLMRMNGEEQKFLLGHELTHFFHRKTSVIANFLEAILPFLAGGIAAAMEATRNAPPKTSIANTLKSIGIFSIIFTVSRYLIEIPMRVFDRRLELDADRGALLLTKDIEAAKSQFTKNQQYFDELDRQVVQPTSHGNVLAKEPITRVEPQRPVSHYKRLLRNHPTDIERITHLEKVKKEMDSGSLDSKRLSKFY